MLTRYHTIDIYENQEWPEDINGVLIYSENEYGCASHIAVKGLLGDAKPAGRILTHLISNMVFNQTKDYEHVGWDYYFYEDKVIININKWPQTPIMPLHEAQATWIHCYPPVRDLLAFIKDKYGDIGHLSFVTSTTIHDSLNTDIFAIHSPDKLMAYFFNTQAKVTIAPKHKVGIEGDLFFSPPAWMFPHFANEMGYQQTATIFSGHDPEAEHIDSVASLTLFRWLNTITGSKVTKHNYNRSLKQARVDTEETLAARAELEELINEANQSEAPNMLWG
tara:strand:+ start:1780 stop:2613 length:834 start_codon:yes stop_codon:yes gene_type:complete